MAANRLDAFHFPMIDTGIQGLRVLGCVEGVAGAAAGA